MVAESVFPSTLHWRPFLREPLFVIAPPGTPTGTAEQWLPEMPFVRFRNDVPLAHMIDRELARMNVMLNDVAEMDTVSSITACVAHGLGVSIVPEIAILKPAMPVEQTPFGSPQLYRQFGLVEPRRGGRKGLIDELHRELVLASGANA